ncbi:pilus assembly protein CpaF [Babesia caballi]|uniref:Pilus assembly protein CpaF n=1 Tax=Babesia caballi TaxID=5871 RepID=A0AAV4LPN7_BABCB|nr:pilus assembly protein CpaF [Babesia caballi]
MEESAASEATYRPSSVSDLLLNLTEQQTRLMETYKGFLESMRLESNLHETSGKLKGLKQAGSELIELQKDHIMKMLVMMYPIFRIVMPPSQFKEDACIQMLGNKAELASYDLVELSCVLRCYFAKLALYVYHMATFVKDRAGYERAVSADPNLNFHRDPAVHVDPADDLSFFDPSRMDSATHLNRMDPSLEESVAGTQDLFSSWREQGPSTPTSPEQYSAEHLYKLGEQIAFSDDDVLHQQGTHVSHQPYDRAPVNTTQSIHDGPDYIGISAAHVGPRDFDEYEGPNRGQMPHGISKAYGFVDTGFNSGEGWRNCYGSPMMPREREVRTGFPGKQVTNDAYERGSRLYSANDPRYSMYDAEAAGGGITSVRTFPEVHRGAPPYMPNRVAPNKHYFERPQPHQMNQYADVGPLPFGVEQRQPQVYRNVGPPNGPQNLEACFTDDYAYYPGTAPPNAFKPLDRSGIFGSQHGQPVLRPPSEGQVERTLVPATDRLESIINGRSEPDDDVRSPRDGILCCGVGGYPNKAEARSRARRPNVAQEIYHPSFYVQHNRVGGRVDVKGKGGHQKDMTYLFYNEPMRSCDASAASESHDALGFGRPNYSLESYSETDRQSDVQAAFSHTTNAKSASDLRSNGITGAGRNFNQAHPTDELLHQAVQFMQQSQNLSRPHKADISNQQQSGWWYQSSSAASSDVNQIVSSDRSRIYTRAPNIGMGGAKAPVPPPHFASNDAFMDEVEHSYREPVVQAKFGASVEPEAASAANFGIDRDLERRCDAFLSVQLSQEDIMADQIVESSDREGVAQDVATFSLIDPPSDEALSHEINSESMRDIRETGHEPEYLRERQLNADLLALVDSDGSPPHDSHPYEPNPQVSGHFGTAQWCFEAAVDEAGDIETHFSSNGPLNDEVPVDVPSSPSADSQEANLSSSRIEIPPLDMSKLHIRPRF